MIKTPEGERLGTIDGAGFAYANNYARLPHAAGMQLIQMISARWGGNGYANHTFDIVVGAKRLEGCSISAEGGPGDFVELMYLRER